MTHPNAHVRKTNYLDSKSRNKQAEAVENLKGRSHLVAGQKSIKNVYTLAAIQEQISRMAPDSMHASSVNKVYTSRTIPATLFHFCEIGS